MGPRVGAALPCAAAALLCALIAVAAGPAAAAAMGRGARRALLQPELPQLPPGLAQSLPRLPPVQLAERSSNASAQSPAAAPPPPRGVSLAALANSLTPAGAPPTAAGRAAGAPPATTGSSAGAEATAAAGPRAASARPAVAPQAVGLSMPVTQDGAQTLTDSGLQRIQCRAVSKHTSSVVLCLPACRS